MCIRFVVLDINTLQETKQLLMAITNTLKVHYHFQIKIIDKVFTCNMIARFRYYFEWAFFAFLTFRSRFLNPKTLLHLYNTVALSPALLGCENCKYIHVSSFDLQTFISFQHFVCMDVLKLPEFCRSYIGESIIFFSTNRCRNLRKTFVILCETVSLELRKENIFDTPLFVHLQISTNPVWF